MAARIPAPAIHDDLIAVLTWEGRLDDAWAVADEHGASLSVWMELAKASETYLADLRHRHGQKTKFIRLLDEAGLQ